MHIALVARNHMHISRTETQLSRPWGRLMRGNGGRRPILCVHAAWLQRGSLIPCAYKQRARQWVSAAQG